jgi:hypothetical protein
MCTQAGSPTQTVDGRAHDPHPPCSDKARRGSSSSTASKAKAKKSRVEVEEEEEEEQAEDDAMGLDVPARPPPRASSPKIPAPARRAPAAATPPADARDVYHEDETVIMSARKQPVRPPVAGRPARAVYHIDDTVTMSGRKAAGGRRSSLQGLLSRPTAAQEDDDDEEEERAPARPHARGYPPALPSRGEHTPQGLGASQMSFPPTPAPAAPAGGGARQRNAGRAGSASPPRGAAPAVPAEAAAAAKPLLPFATLYVAVASLAVGVAVVGMRSYWLQNAGLWREHRLANTMLISLRRQLGEHECGGEGGPSLTRDQLFDLCELPTADGEAYSIELEHCVAAKDKLLAGSSAQVAEACARGVGGCSYTALSGASRPWLCAAQKGVWALVEAFFSVLATVARALLAVATAHPLPFALALAVVVGTSLLRRHLADAAVRTAMEDRLEARVRSSLRLGDHNPLLGQIPLDVLHEEGLDALNIHRLAVSKPFEAAWKGAVERLKRDKRLAFTVIVGIDGRRYETVEVRADFSPRGRQSLGSSGTSLSSSAGVGGRRGSSPVPYPPHLQPRTHA